MSVHAGSRGQLGCIFLIPFPKQAPHLETPLAAVHRVTGHVCISYSRWGSVRSPRLEFSGSKCQPSALTRTGLNFLKMSFDLRDLGIFTMLGLYSSWAAASLMVLPGLGPWHRVPCSGLVASALGCSRSCCAGCRAGVLCQGASMPAASRILFFSAASSPRPP